MYNISETVLPIYINGQCPIIKTFSDVTLNLSSKDYIISLKIYENRYKQKISTNPYFGYFRYSVFTKKFYILYVTQRIMFESRNPKC